MLQLTFADEIEEVAKGEEIEAIVIDEGTWNGYDFDERHEAASNYLNKILTWDVARPLLDYKYDRGYGAQDCHGIIAWTKNMIIYIHEYDGSTAVVSLPRHPNSL